ncbi:hypothetical protein IJD44_00700 [bacterium]|nr:hypothetical protein [bacterium]
MATIKELKELALHAAKGTAPANFSNDNVNEALRAEMSALCSSINEFQRNKHDIFDIIITAADEIVPKKVLDAVGIFAEVQSVPQGQKILFKTKKGHARARKFLTQVGLSGLYETFRLDSDTFEMQGMAIGGAARIDFERFLNGADSMADLMEIITTGLTDAVFVQIHKALRAAVTTTNRPDTNLVINNTFVADDMQRLVNVVRAYGSSAVIFAPPEFVAAMGPDAIVPVGTNYQGIYHPQDIDAIHNTGFINLFRGTPIIQMQQSFLDDSNTSTWVDPQLAYILPTGGEKVVKVGLEGQTQMWDFINPDQSIEIHTYKKMGTAILAYNNWAIYQNTGITQTFENPYVNL